MNHSLTWGLILSISLVSCKKEDPKTPDPKPTTSNVTLNFQHYFNNDVLVFNTKYTNENGDPVTITKFNYYISNIVFQKADNSTYAVPESYFIVKHSSSGSRLVNVEVPIADYVGVSFVLGVDSARNCSGAQTGGLDVAYASDMYWSWNSGYIFLKLEGASDSSGNTTKGYEYHIGGFKGTNKAQRYFSFSFPTTSASTQHSPTVHLKVNAAEIFRGALTVDLKTQYSVLSSNSAAKMIADNYSDMITFSKVE